MITGQTLKLFFRCILQLFNILFFMLLAFALIFGLVIAFSNDYFVSLANARIFDNLIDILKNAFVYLNAQEAIHAINLFLVSIREVAVSNLTWFIVTSIWSFAVICGCFTWLKFSLNKKIYSEILPEEAYKLTNKGLTKKILISTLISCTAGLLLGGAIIITAYYLAKLMLFLQFGNVLTIILIGIYLIIMFSLKNSVFYSWSFSIINSTDGIWQDFKTGLSCVTTNPISNFLKFMLIEVIFVGFSVLICQINILMLLLSFTMTYLYCMCYGANVYKRSKQKLAQQEIAISGK